ncbi:hypothetical protein F383_39360 [Gossypium arboreum]|uniref:Uncharacterized protein n=1 Tax=Gossypium arboreum TaxID=29729 RepID=A0A0B0MJB5_GOSAR|nr:hypothetical protein F383_39360 [Gossypium arboreum]
MIYPGYKHIAMYFFTTI